MLPVGCGGDTVIVVDGDEISALVSSDSNNLMNVLFFVKAAALVIVNDLCIA